LVVTWPFVPVQVRYLLSRVGIQIDTTQKVDDSVVDTDQDGLSDIAEINFFGTNPAEPDTDQDGLSDGTEIVIGSDPNLPGENSFDLDGDGLSNDVEENVYGTDPGLADTDGDGFPDGIEVIHGYSPVTADNENKAMTLEQRSRNWREELKDARIIIPKIGVNSPIIWLETTDDEAIMEAMPDGVVHYARSAFPGNPGNTVLVGHSSNYWWDPGPENYVFALLDRVENGDEIIIQNENFRYIYQVESSQIKNPDETDYFEQTGNPVLTIQTSYPAGTSLQRLVVRSKQINESISSR
jgi:LPXTG-site transpeptidase (sortase) family protein